MSSQPWFWACTERWDTLQAGARIARSSHCLHHGPGVVLGAGEVSSSCRCGPHLTALLRAGPAPRALRATGGQARALGTTMLAPTLALRLLWGAGKGHARPACQRGSSRSTASSCHWSGSGRDNWWGARVYTVQQGPKDMSVMESRSMAGAPVSGREGGGVLGWG